MTAATASPSGSIPSGGSAIGRSPTKETRIATGIPSGTCAPAASTAAGPSKWRSPFKSLRFRPGAEQLWGIQLGRDIRSSFEEAYLTAVPISAGPGQFRVSAAGTLTGLQVPAGNRTFEVKPYVIGSLATDRTVVPPISNDGRRAGGRRRQVRTHREPDRGLHLEHRFRAGRGRRAADQPDAVPACSSRKSASSFWRVRASSTSGGRPAPAAAGPRGGVSARRASLDPETPPPSSSAGGSASTRDAPCRFWAADA